MAERKKEKSDSATSFGKIRGMFQMMKMMGNGFKGSKGSFDCSSIMEAMMNSKEDGPFDCCTIMEEIKDDKSGTSFNCSSMMEQMMKNRENKSEKNED
jgi:hypothetical protein